MIARQVYLEYFSRKQCISRAFHENQRPGGELCSSSSVWGQQDRTEGT